MLTTRDGNHVESATQHFRRDIYQLDSEEGLVQVGADHLGTQIYSQNGMKATYVMVLILTQAGKLKPGHVVTYTPFTLPTGVEPV